MGNRTFLRFLGWGSLVLGMGVFLLIKETTIAVRLFAAACCVAAGVLLEAGKKRD